MKYFRVQGAVFNGVRVLPVEVECVQSRRLPHLQVLGCSATAALELRERLMAAFSSSHLSFPARRITIRLSPAISGTEIETIDLASALAVLGSTGALHAKQLEGLLAYGSLRLDGAIQNSGENLAFRRFLRDSGHSGALLPWEMSGLLEQEKCKNGGGFHNLTDVLAFLRSGAQIAPRASIALESQTDGPLDATIDRIEGQNIAKRMLEVAAAGAHHALLLGPRGIGKSMLARALPGLLPPPSAEQREELRLLHRKRREVWDGAIPFRAPDPSLSLRKLVGGDMRSLGEISLAHGGVLFLDELLERGRESLEALRMPMERGFIPLHAGAGELPAAALVVGAANLCPCGARGDTLTRCVCTPWEMRRYRRRLSLALADRFDLRLELSPEEQAEKQKIQHAELRRRVLFARQCMLDRQGKPNARLELSEVFVKPWDEPAMRRWRAETLRAGASLRGAASLARVALTISDLAERSEVGERDVLEAAHYRGELGV